MSPVKRNLLMYLFFTKMSQGGYRNFISKIQLLLNFWYFFPAFLSKKKDIIFQPIRGNIYYFPAKKCKIFVMQQKVTSEKNKWNKKELNIIFLSNKIYNMYKLMPDFHIKKFVNKTGFSISFVSDKKIQLFHSQPQLFHFQPIFKNTVFPAFPAFPAIVDTPSSYQTFYFLIMVASGKLPILPLVCRTHQVTIFCSLLLSRTKLLVPCEFKMKSARCN